MSKEFVFPIEAYRQGMDDERERIVSLLEEEMLHSEFPDSPCVRCAVIAIIKGENK